MKEIFDQLAAPFPVDEIEWRVGATSKDKSKGIALAYIDARAVMDRLDKILGPEGWQCRYPHANGRTCCEIGVRIGDEWIWKSDGAGDTDYEGVKGAFSDSFKRAAVRWGIGRYLYDLSAPWVSLEKERYIAKADVEKLRREYAQKFKAPARQPIPFEGAEETKSRPANTIGRVELRNKYTALIRDVQACDDSDSLEALLNSDDTKRIINATMGHLPQLLDPGEETATWDEIVRKKRNELAEKEAA